jgi:response regulator RpfG family c-di-GMP phosphodiesterase
MSQELNTPPASVRPILIVDDEEIVLVALRETLLHEGYNVVSSPHAVHALSVLKEQEFSVVITDQQMPMVSGLEFLAQVRQIRPEATRILITAVLNLSTLIDAINKAEIHRFVVKPWSREELLASVKSAVERFDFISNNSRLLTQTLAANRELAKLNRSLAEQVARLTRENMQGKTPPTG